MKNCLTLLILFLSISMFSQNYKFGKVSKEELEEKYYPTDSTVIAAYLYKKRRTYYDYSTNDGFRIITEVHERIKIYNKEAFDLATRKVSYYSAENNKNREKVKSIEAVTYNLEGGKIAKTKASKKDVFNEEITRTYSRKKVTLPNVKEGSVLEFKYKLISPHITSIDDLEFQYAIPVKKMFYAVEIPEYFTFKQRTKGYYFIKPQEKMGKRSILWGDGSKVTYEAKVYTFDATSIPGLKDDEPYVNNVGNYRGGMKYEIDHVYFPNSRPQYFSSTWSDVAKGIYSVSRFGGEIEKTNYYKDDLTALLQGASSDAQKIAGIFQLVKEKIKWNGYYGVYPDNTLKKAYKEGVGNVASINLMLVSMLRSAGLEANPVLVSTKSNGVPLFPTRDGFNYVIAAVSFGEGFVYMDASERYSLPNMLPPRALNWQGRLIFKNGTSQWLNLSSGTKSIEDNFVSVKMDNEGIIEGMMRTKFSNLGALEYRNKYNKIKEEEVISKLEDDLSIEIEDYKVANKYEIGKAVTRTMKFSSEDLVEEINGKMYVNPMLFMGYSSNPFKLDERKFPVEFSSPWKEKNTISISIPAGYSIESSPETKALGLPENMGVFKYQVLAGGNKVKIISILEFNTSTIPASYYETLKGFFGEFVKKQSEKIVLVKS